MTMENTQIISGKCRVLHYHHARAEFKVITTRARSTVGSWCSRNRRNLKSKGFPDIVTRIRDEVKTTLYILFVF